MARRRELQRHNASLRSEIDNLRGRLMAYRTAVEHLLASCEAVIDVVDQRKARRHRVAGSLRAHMDHVMALHQELSAATSIAANYADAEAIGPSVRSVINGLSLAGVTTASLLTVGLLADVRTLAPDEEEVNIVIEQNKTIQLSCDDVLGRIERGELTLPPPPAQSPRSDSTERPPLSPLVDDLATLAEEADWLAALHARPMFGMPLLGEVSMERVISVLDDARHVMGDRLGRGLEGEIEEARRVASAIASATADLPSLSEADDDTGESDSDLHLEDHWSARQAVFDRTDSVREYDLHSLARVLRDVRRAVKDAKPLG